MPTKIVKEDADLFSNCKSNACNESIISCNFMSVLKLVDVTSVHKNKSWLKKLTIDQLAYYLIFQRFLKGECLDKYKNILKLYFWNFNVVFE